MSDQGLKDPQDIDEKEDKKEKEYSITLVFLAPELYVNESSLDSHLKKKAIEFLWDWIERAIELLDAEFENYVIQKNEVSERPDGDEWTLIVDPHSDLIYNQAIRCVEDFWKSEVNKIKGL